jgi:3-phenylpropionate/trans-cinnamate dioxygenase ferredoxin subunit
MADFTELLKVDDLKNGQMKAYMAGGREVLMAKVGDKFFAADNRCPHFGGNLSQGKLDDTIVTCPRHGSQYDLKDGRVVRWTDWSGAKLGIAKIFKSPRPLRVYEVKVEADRVLIKV